MDADQRVDQRVNGSKADGWAMTESVDSWSLLGRFLLHASHVRVDAESWIPPIDPWSEGGDEVDDVIGEFEKSSTCRGRLWFPSPSFSQDLVCFYFLFFWCY